MLETLVTIFLGPPRALFFAYVLQVMAALVPCPEVRGSPGMPALPNETCLQDQRTAAAVITYVALEDEDPNDAAAILLGAGAHETGFRTKLQEHGRAVSWWQLDGLKTEEEREFYLTHDVEAARRALGIARGCRRSMISYASGRCFSKDPNVLEVAGQLRRCIESARRGGAWRCKAWRSPPSPTKGKRRRTKGIKKASGQRRS